LLIIAVDFHDRTVMDRRRDALDLVYQLMFDNDKSPNKDHPWIPGSVCAALKALIVNLRQLPLMEAVDVCELCGSIADRFDHNRIQCRKHPGHMGSPLGGGWTDCTAPDKTPA
jgi:hypothetical protein